jgi:signal transduction histidine kinase/CheY-like chemotaxis protein
VKIKIVFYKLFQWLVNPANHVDDRVKLRRIKLQAIILLVLFVAVTVDSILQLIFRPDFLLTYLLMNAMGLMALLGYFFNRKGYVQRASAIANSTLSLTIFLSVLLVPKGINADYLYVLCLPLVLGGIMMSGSGLLILSSLSVLGMFLVPLLSPYITWGYVFSPIGVVATIAVLMLVHRRHRDRLEADRREELNEKEEQLRQAQKMESVGRLAGGIAHDFNNLLTVILGYCEMLDEDVRTSQSGGLPVESIQGITMAAERAASLTQQLLTFSRKQTPQPKLISMKEVLTHLEKMLHRLIGENILLDISYQPNLAAVHIDPSQLEQVILNLTVNGAEAMDKGGTLRIDIQNIKLDDAFCKLHNELEMGDYVRITVSDTGTGIDKQTGNRIFDPFFTTKDPGKGTGLGLSTVYGIVKQNNGFIHFESNEGQGTTFCVYFPFADANDNLPSTQPENIAETPLLTRGAETLLVVEDEDRLREVITLSLEGYGYNVFAMPNGSKALQFLEQYPDQKPAMLITDIVLPGISGKELADDLKHRFQRMKILYISGYTESTIESYGIDMDCVSFLSKPFSPILLTQRVREMLD